MTDTEQRMRDFAEDADVDTPPAQRHAAWLKDDPAELRRAADEWQRLGYGRHAEYLRTWAQGERPPRIVPRPF